MSLNDPIADMLTRVRNAARNRKKTVVCLNTKVCRGIAEALKGEGYITDFELVDDGRQGKINIKLRYGPRGETILHEIKRESTPGCRVYRKVDDLHHIRQGLGISIISTSSGVLSDRQCRDQKVGGELLCTVI
ncbi:MAG: 30S ribosomal protein S8 [Phycisphaeraceae bacterium]|nr:30S ribosomal protein S8 [Phycisphaeraceae bacterium]MCW5762959.1 30S ribosomal protein S8 [Phycisphaeraceae bacterium]